MSAQIVSPPLWEKELRALVRSKIKEQVKKNVRDPAYQSMWIRRPHNFVDIETDKLLDECWALLRVWHPAYDALRLKTPLTCTWNKMSITEKCHAALDFKTFFYDKGGYYQNK